MQQTALRQLCYTKQILRSECLNDLNTLDLLLYLDGSTVFLYIDLWMNGALISVVTHLFIVPF